MDIRLKEVRALLVDQHVLCFARLEKREKIELDLRHMYTDSMHTSVSIKLPPAPLWWKRRVRLPTATTAIISESPISMCFSWGASGRTLYSLEGSFVAEKVAPESPSHLSLPVSGWSR